MANIPVAQFPAPSHVGSVDAGAEAAAVLDAVNQGLSRADLDALSRLFVGQGFWRDHLALSWEFRTVQGHDGILAFLQHCAGSKDGLRLRRVALDASPSRAPQLVPIDGESVQGIVAFILLETAVGSGQGVMRLVLDQGAWKLFTLYTSLRELRGHPEAVLHRRPHGIEDGRENWADKRRRQVDFDDREPAVLIVGAGQAGLTAAARLKTLGIGALVIDRNGRVGDNWRKRYHRLVLHDPVWYDHMPYLAFPPQWPVFTPKDKLAQFLEAYADLMELDVWTRTELGACEWDGRAGAWTVTVSRVKDDGSRETRTLRPRHVVQATGHSGLKHEPALRGADRFEGDRLCHSCNSGHDIAQDFVDKGYDVTMVQRSSTLVVSTRAIVDIGLRGFYAEDGPPVDDADMLVQSLPSSVLKALQMTVTDRQRELDRDTLAGLARAGFRLDSGPDGSGLFFKYFERGGGYYIDVGTSALIADGRISIKHGEVAEVLPHGLRFADGSELAADEIVLATGYQNMRAHTRLLFGDGVADRVGDVWGLNDEGEMRGVWHKSGHPGFWFHGGNLALCRYYSRLLALQIQGQEEGLYRYGET